MAYFCLKTQKHILMPHLLMFQLHLLKTSFCPVYIMYAVIILKLPRNFTKSGSLSLPTILPHTSVRTIKVQGSPLVITGTCEHTVLVLEAGGRQWPQLVVVIV